MFKKNDTCCFLGHRKIKTSEELKTKIANIIEKLITENEIRVFLFGSKSQFDTLCFEIVTELKQKYPYIKRTYVRAEFPYISESYRLYLLKRYDDTYFPERILNAGVASYVERNTDMIDKSDVCIFYYDENYLPSRRKKTKRAITDYQPKSGTKIAYEYAKRKGVKIFNVFDEACQKG